MRGRGIIWVNLEVEMPGIKFLESEGVRGYYRAFHPFGQPDGESCKRSEDAEALVWLHKED